VGKEAAEKLVTGNQLRTIKKHCPMTGDGKKKRQDRSSMRKGEQSNLSRLAKGMPPMKEQEIKAKKNGTEKRVHGNRKLCP